MRNRNIELSEVILDIAAGPFGSNLKKSCFQEDGFPIIDGANLKGFKLTDNITKFVTEGKARSLHRSIAKRNDVIVTISGTLGQISYIPENSEYEEYLCSQRQFRVTFDTTRVYVPYLVFFFHTYEGQNKILSFANQVGVPALAQPLKNFRKIRIDLPEIKEQKKIASIIELLNNKIENNDAINNNLSDMMQTIYQQNFNSSEQANNQRSVLSNICSYSTEKISVASLNLSNYYSTENMLPEKAGAVDASSLPAMTQTTKCKVGDVLISNIRPYFKKIVYCQSECGCSTDVLCFTPKKPELSAYVYSTLYADGFFNYMVAGSKGTKMPRGDKQQIMSYPVYAPTDVELESFNQLAKPVLSQIEHNRLENINLVALRNSLLPKLISGELDVSDIQL